MSKKEKTKFRYNNYDTNDAGIMFLLALVLPQFLMALALLICSYATGLSFVATEEGQQTFMDVYPHFATRPSNQLTNGENPNIQIIPTDKTIKSKSQFNFLM